GREPGLHRDWQAAVGPCPLCPRSGLATDLFSPKTFQAEQDQTKGCEQHTHPAMPVFKHFRLSLLSPPKDFFGNCGLSLGEFTFGQRTFKLLVGVSVERLTHHN